MFSELTLRPLGRLRALALMVVFGLVLVACGDASDDGGGDGGQDDPDAASEDGDDAADDDAEAGGDGGEPYRIGALLGLTGGYSALGEPQADAVALFEDWINGQGGVNGRDVEIVVVDSTSSESEAVNQIRRLASNEGVVGIIGPSSSGESIAIRSAAAEMAVPTLTLASSRAIVEPVEQFVFKDFPSTDLSLGAQLAQAEEAGFERVAIMGANNAYGTEAVDLLPDMAGDFGLEVVASETFDPEATDMTAQLTNIRGEDPDIILVWAVEPQTSIVARNAAELGLDDVTFSHAPGAASQAFITNGGDAVEGHLVQGMKTLVPDSVEEDDPQVDVIQTFGELYREEYGELPGQFAGNAWDALLILTHALEEADIDPSDLESARVALAESIESNVTNFPGLNGIYNYSQDDHAGQTLRGLAVLRVENGEFVLETAIEQD